MIARYLFPSPLYSGGEGQGEGVQHPTRRQRVSARAYPPCMIQRQLTPAGSCDLSVGAKAESRKVRPRRPATDRSPTGDCHAAGEQDRGRSRGLIPNSRQSRLKTSSHSQGRERAMSTPQDAAAVIFVGVDVAKNSVEVCRGADGDRFLTLHEPAALIKELTACGLCLVVMEATGGYERRWVAALLDAGIPVAVVNPKRIRDFAKAMGILAKSDRIDARVIAQ